MHGVPVKNPQLETASCSGTDSDACRSSVSQDAHGTAAEHSDHSVPQHKMLSDQKALDQDYSMQEQSSWESLVMS